MRATSAFPDTASTKAAIDAPPAPFSQVFVTTTQQEHTELRLTAKQWQGLHRKAVTRLDQQEVRHDRIVRELKTQALKSTTALQAELDCALAQVRDLQKRLFSSKNEQSRPSESRSKAAVCRKRGQQTGSVGHRSTAQAVKQNWGASPKLATAICAHYCSGPMKSQAA